MKLPVKVNKIGNKRIIHRRVKYIFGILVILIILGIIYEQLGEHLDSREFKAPGQLINIDGHNMHIFAEGHDSPTVVFASGWAIPSPYIDFYPLYSEIAKHTRVVVYDRPGYGWSDASNTPRDIDTITKELHELLIKSGEKPPYILVGHSIGSLEVLRFAQLYQNEVNGVVLLDGSNPDMYTHMVKPSLLAKIEASVYHNSLILLNKSGISRLLFTVVPNFYYSTPLASARNNLALVPGKLRYYFMKIDEAMFLKNCFDRDQDNEAKNKEANALKVEENGYINNIPLVIFTSGEYNSYKSESENQARLKNWSSESKQIIVKDSTHAIHWWHPELINQEITNHINSTKTAN
ncbi:alpha/beta hydrolase [Desulfosporosinus sp. BG]|uniref:alpha/beta hydrolase n=1 Tax=Desulfosporosinus sp. BG TaxID=1633135 RepID=UPI000857E112|nr:alpha/beta hydrolase [Desulfosporosinus sp. BG]ODA40880.1 alpha/beta hydrolase fold [Desulfosporosinus sp. BG]